MIGRRYISACMVLLFLSATFIYLPLQKTEAENFKYRVHTAPRITGILPADVRNNGGDPKVTVGSTITVLAYVTDSDEKCDEDQQGAQWQPYNTNEVVYKIELAGAGTLTHDGHYIATGVKTSYAAPANAPANNPTLTYTPNDTWGLQDIITSSGQEVDIPGEAAGKNGTENDDPGTAIAQTLEIVTDAPSIELDETCTPNNLNPNTAMIGAMTAQMKAVSDPQKNWDGYVVTEAISYSSTTCTDADYVGGAPGGNESHLTFGNFMCSGSSSFTVGQAYPNFGSCQRTGEENHFWDTHRYTNNNQFMVNGVDCEIVCDQDYKAGGNVAGSFDLKFAFKWNATNNNVVITVSKEAN